MGTKQTEGDSEEDRKRTVCLEEDDTCFVIKVTAQDQTAAPVSTVKLARLAEYEWKEVCVFYRYVYKYKQLTEISDNDLPFNYKEPLSIVTEEELQADGARVEAEEKEWREKVREEQKRPDKQHRLEEKEKIRISEVNLRSWFSFFEM